MSPELVRVLAGAVPFVVVAMLWILFVAIRWFEEEALDEEYETPPEKKPRCSK